MRAASLPTIDGTHHSFQKGLVCLLLEGWGMGRLNNLSITITDVIVTTYSLFFPYLHFLINTLLNLHYILFSSLYICLSQLTSKFTFILSFITRNNILTVSPKLMISMLTFSFLSFLATLIASLSSTSMGLPTKATILILWFLLWRCFRASWKRRVKTVR